MRWGKFWLSLKFSRRLATHTTRNARILENRIREKPRVKQNNTTMHHTHKCVGLHYCLELEWVKSLFCLLQGMGSPSSAVEAARRRLRDVVRRGEKLGLTRSDLVSLPAARRLTSSGSRWCWRSTSLAITVITVIMAVTAILTKCYVYHQATTSAYPSGVSAASLDPWWQPQQLQRLVSAAGLFVCLWFVFISSSTHESACLIMLYYFVRCKSSINL